MTAFDATTPCPACPLPLDGKLVGDIGEAVAAELFGLTLKPGGGTGIDGHTPDGRSVQVRRREPAEDPCSGRWMLVRSTSSSSSSTSRS
ncbi:DUF6998 domain-containing protein [Rhizobium leguminosarum]